MDKDIYQYNKMIDDSFLKNFKRRWKHQLEIEYFNNFPIKLFDIAIIYENLVLKKDYSELIVTRIKEKLIDIKTLFFFINTAEERFYLGPSWIATKGEIERVDENTISILQLNHYKVYLFSTIYERIIDLFEMIYFNEEKTFKNDKWNKKWKRLNSLENFKLITEAEHLVLNDFKEKTRRAEIHGLSKVIRHLYSDKWDHFQKEEMIIKDIIRKFGEENTSH